MQHLMQVSGFAPDAQSQIQRQQRWKILEEMTFFEHLRDCAAGRKRQHPFPDLARRRRINQRYFHVCSLGLFFAVDLTGPFDKGIDQAARDLVKYRPHQRRQRDAVKVIAQA